MSKINFITDYILLPIITFFMAIGECYCLRALINLFVEN